MLPSQSSIVVAGGGVEVSGPRHGVATLERHNFLIIFTFYYFFYIF